MAAGEPRPFFGGAVVAGSHLESMRAVAAGESDVAAIDAVCWALACREYPDLTNRLRSLGTTAPTPGLPLVTAAGRSSAEIALIREALSECLADPQTEEARRALFITGFDVLGEEDYRAAIALLDAEAMARLTPAIA
jgi:ABC-type phosphate/phosphonate transport system substrate-binding protein